MPGCLVVGLHFQGRPPEAANPSLCGTTASRYPHPARPTSDGPPTMVDSPFNHNSRPRSRHDLELLRTTVEICLNRSRSDTLGPFSRDGQGRGEGFLAPSPRALAGRGLG